MNANVNCVSVKCVRNVVSANVANVKHVHASCFKFVYRPWPIPSLAASRLNISYSLPRSPSLVPTTLVTNNVPLIMLQFPAQMILQLAAFLILGLRNVEACQNSLLGLRLPCSNSAIAKLMRFSSYCSFHRPSWPCNDFHRRPRTHRSWIVLTSRTQFVNCPLTSAQLPLVMKSTSSVC